ncbi:MAG: glycosyltransferase, partial [Akkermansiaceae bacterium]|nr:glycosyltransferase [Akkermansiaceae bacterium]
LLGLGRLHRNKAHDVSLRILAQVPDGVLLVVGSGELRGELEGLAEELGVKERVRFLGWRRDIENLYATADLCLFPSRVEPLGNVVLESWS